MAVNEIGDEGVKMLNETLKDNSTLTKLDISSIQIYSMTKMLTSNYFDKWKENKLERKFIGYDDWLYPDEEYFLVPNKYLYAFYFSKRKRWIVDTTSRDILVWWPHCVWNRDHFLQFHFITIAQKQMHLHLLIFSPTTHCHPCAMMRNSTIVQQSFEDLLVSCSNEHQLRNQTWLMLTKEADDNFFTQSTHQFICLMEWTASSKSTVLPWTVNWIRLPKNEKGEFFEIENDWRSVHPYYEKMQ